MNDDHYESRKRGKIGVQVTVNQAKFMSLAGYRTLPIYIHRSVEQFMLYWVNVVCPDCDTEFDIADQFRDFKSILTFYSKI